MAYRLDTITIRTNNTPAGLEKIQEVWLDIMNGTLPLLFDSEHNFQQGISPVSRYSNYAEEETGDYDLSILGVTAEFFQKLDEAVRLGRYQKYDVSDENGDIGRCTQLAWKQVWQAQRQGEIKRSFTADYESAVPPAYAKDGKAHCYLYIAVHG